MASPKQLAANQANAQHSTGPRTESGKRASRLNARKHGMCGQIIMRTDEEHAAYELYSDRIMTDLAPGSYIEQDFAERIVFDSWRLRKSGIISHHLIALGDAFHNTDLETENDEHNDTLAYIANEKSLNLLSLYQQRLDRAIRSTLDMLRKMQKERRAEAERSAQQQARIVKPAQPRPVQVIGTAAASPATGFVHATPLHDPPLPPSEPSDAPENMAA